VFRNGVHFQDSTSRHPVQPGCGDSQRASTKARAGLDVTTPYLPFSELLFRQVTVAS